MALKSSKHVARFLDLQAFKYEADSETLQRILFFLNNKYLHCIVNGM